MVREAHGTHSYLVDRITWADSRPVLGQPLGEQWLLEPSALLTEPFLFSFLFFPVCVVEFG